MEVDREGKARQEKVQQTRPQPRNQCQEKSQEPGRADRSGLRSDQASTEPQITEQRISGGGDRPESSFQTEMSCGPLSSHASVQLVQNNKQGNISKAKLHYISSRQQFESPAHMSPPGAAPKSTQTSTSRRWSSSCFYLSLAL